VIALLHSELFRIELRARMPFRYGIATMTEVPHAILRLTFSFNGREQAGVAADSLPPKWFTKDPARSLPSELAEMYAVIHVAVRHAGEIRAPTAFAFWHELYARQTAWASANKVPPLLAHFGTSLVERALLEAQCRVHGVTLAAALQANLLGLDLAAMHPQLAGSNARDWLPAKPSAEVFARHTVGLSDPIVREEIPAGDEVNDGLPQTLIECVRFYGLRHFKIKINGDESRDRERLQRIGKVFATECQGEPAFSLDGNESFRDIPSFADYMRRLMAVPELKSLWPRLLFIEQPWHRDVALSPTIGELAQTWPDRPPIIIDESDAEVSSLAQALTLGYAGTSHKNCKGIFKSVANACLLAQRRRAGHAVVLSGEDLANVGPVALTQDLAAAAALGITSVERNGHHYFAGLSQFPPALQAHVLAHHSDLFVRSDQGWPRLNLRDGRLDLRSVNAAPFGVAPGLDLSELTAETLP